MTQTEIERRLHEDFQIVKKYPINDESKTLRELHDLVKSENSEIVSSDGYLMIDHKVLDLENKVYFIVQGEFEEPQTTEKEIKDTNQTEFEKELREEYKSVKKYPLDESKTLRELITSISTSDDEVWGSSSGDTVYYGNKVLDIKNNEYFVVEKEFKDTQLERRLRKEYKHVAKLPLNEVKVLRELVKAVRDSGSLLDREDGLVQYYDRIVDIENDCLYIVDGEIEEDSK